MVLNVLTIVLSVVVMVVVVKINIILLQVYVSRLMLVLYENKGESQTLEGAMLQVQNFKIL